MNARLELTTVMYKQLAQIPLDHLHVLARQDSQEMESFVMVRFLIILYRYSNCLI